jgi:MraZ protein
MPAAKQLIQGEFTRTLDERFRLSIPQELVDLLTTNSADCVLVKELAGCLSLWPAETWRQRQQASVDLIRAKIQAGKLDERLPQVQALGRLLSTRHREVHLAGRGRLLIPEGFREFLQVEAGGDVMVVGAAVCIEIWNLAAWRAHLEAQLPGFQQLFDQLAG